MPDEMKANRPIVQVTLPKYADVPEAGELGVCLACCCVHLSFYTDYPACCSASRDIQVCCMQVKSSTACCQRFVYPCWICSPCGMLCCPTSPVFNPLGDMDENGETEADKDMNTCLRCGSMEAVCDGIVDDNEGESEWRCCEILAGFTACFCCRSTSRCRIESDLAKLTCVEGVVQMLCIDARVALPTTEKTPCGVGCCGTWCVGGPEQ